MLMAPKEKIINSIQPETPREAQRTTKLSVATPLVSEKNNIFSLENETQQAVNHLF